MITSFKLESDGTMIGTKVWIDGVEQKYIKRLSLHFDAKNMLATVDISRYFGVGNKLKSEYEKINLLKKGDVDIKVVSN